MNLEKSMNDAATMRPGGGSALGRIDQYELLKELGGGGFGTVYLAKDTVSGIEVAVKGLPPFVKNNREEMENIRANFALVARLHHPHIAAALVLHPAKSVAYASEDVRQKLRVLSGDTLMVMEYAPGVTLSQWRKQFPERKVPINQALAIVRQIADALDYAHGEKVIHRDIKPSNVMVETRSGGAVTASVLDFGLAAEIRSSMGRVSQEIHDTSGTRPYMAPEQWSGASQNAATDQYALAVLFHELVTGKVPFSSVFDTGDPVIMLTVVTTRPPDIPADLPKPVRLALEKALAKKPEERFASCGEFVGAIEGRLKVSRRGAETRSKGGVWKAVGIFVILALLAALGAGGWLYYAQRQEAARREQARLAAVQKAEAERKAEEAQRAKEEAERKAAAERKAEEARQTKERADAARKVETERKTEEPVRKAEGPADEKAAEAEAARLAKEKEAAERRRAAEEKRKAEERAAAERKESRRRQLYSDLASVETALESFGQFEHKDAIRAKLDSLTASYKAARTAFSSDDFESAFDMIQELKKPCAELRLLLPTVKAYHLRKASAERAKNAAVAVEAPLYAKKAYDEANAAYEKAVDLARADDYAKALTAMESLEEVFRAVRETATTNPEALYQKGLAAQKAKDNGAAFDLFSKAAAKKHPAALVNLGLIHLKGMGVAKSDSEAFDCFRKAACLNHARAQYLLGGCYAKAIGTKYDKERSRLWMLMAKVNGDRTAADFLSNAGWPVSADEEAAVREILETGSSGRPVSAALRQIASECHRDGKNR